MEWLSYIGDGIASIAKVIASGIGLLLLYLFLIGMWDVLTNKNYGAKARSILGWTLLAAIVLIVFANVFNAIVDSSGNEAIPFVLAGEIGLVLLAASIYFNHVVVGVVGGGLLAAAFSHWIGPITFPK